MGGLYIQLSYFFKGRFHRTWIQTPMAVPLARLAWELWKLDKTEHAHYTVTKSTSMSCTVTNPISCGRAE